jgi:hypothetical protein
MTETMTDEELLANLSNTNTRSPPLNALTEMSLEVQGYDYDNYADYSYEMSANLSPYASQRSKLMAVPTSDGVDIWQEFFTDEGLAYYYRPSTGESRWDSPATLPGFEGAEANSGNVQILSQYQDTDGNWYWYNNMTGESSYA